MSSALGIETKRNSSQAKEKLPLARETSIREIFHIKYGRVWGFFGGGGGGGRQMFFLVLKNSFHFSLKE